MTHSFVILLALAPAMASTLGVAHATPRVTPLGGRGFLSYWQGGAWEQWPVDGALENLRTPLVLQTVPGSGSQPAPAAASSIVLTSVTAAPEGLAPESAAAAPETTPAKKREIVAYEVVGGDTISGIASRFGISTDTLVWANSLKSVNRLSIGDKLKILPVDGMVHTVKSGENLGAIAARYKVTVEDILNYPENGLASADRLQIGQDLVVPGATKPKDPPPAPVVQAAVRPPDPEPAPAAPAPKAAPPSSGFVWPTYGPLFTYFSGWHPGIDISPPWGTPVVAVQGGVVTAVKLWDYSYGWHILVDHGGGYGAMYAHLSAVNVKAGDAIAQGQQVGRVGSTGRSTGPHLHFELYLNGSPIDPLGSLPR